MKIAFSLIEEGAYLHLQHSWNDNILNVPGNIMNKNEMFCVFFLCVKKANVSLISHLLNQISVFSF